MKRSALLLVAIAALWAISRTASAADAADAPGAPAPEPANAAHVLVLENALGEGRPLQLHLAVRDGAVVAAAATSPRYNGALHDVDLAGFQYEGGHYRGTVRVTVNPDAYMPKDGRPFACRAEVAARLEGGAPAGRYTASFGGEDRSGAVSGHLEPPFDPKADYARLRMKLHGALVRLFRARGSNYRYALDMNLTFPIRDGRVGPVQFETIVPDYRRYSAVVEAHDLRLRGNTLAGTFTARVDYGGQAKGSEIGEEVYVYTLRGTVIGNTVGGTYDARFGDEADRGRRFLGTVDRAPPPAPTESIAFLRLHDAMGDGYPVILNLGLADDGLLNGYAWAPGYNHQPHTVDASGLRLDGRRLRGRVLVTIVPDCYRPPETFTMRFDVDAEITDAEVTGRYTGNDSRQDVRGALTGRLRAKREAPKPVTLANLARAQLDLGYALVSGPMPKKDWGRHRPNYASVIFRLEGGKVASVEVVNPTGADVFRATVRESVLAIDGDRLTGRVRFDLASEGLKSGTYAYTFDAIVDGDRAPGFWRGTLDGEPILTKSAKLNTTFHFAD